MNNPLAGYNDGAVKTIVTEDKIIEVPLNEVSLDEDITCGECHQNWRYCKCLHPPYLKSERK